MQDADRAWEGAEYLVDNYFRETDNFWGEIANTRLTTIRRICRNGYEGQAFALHFATNSFPKRLKAAAKRIVSDYSSDVRNTWNGVGKEDVDKIYWRFKEFEGIGDALAKMAQFILVRDYGVAGGRASKKYMSVKPDVHLQRVMFRLGMCEEESARSVIVIADSLKLGRRQISIGQCGISDGHIVIQKTPTVAIVPSKRCATSRTAPLTRIWAVPVISNVG